MKERPILFSGPMVRAILDGRKTQTRRVIKPQPQKLNPAEYQWLDGLCDVSWLAAHSPYGRPGDRLWVREAFGVEYCGSGDVVYRADFSEAESAKGKGTWKPSIHMPRDFSRINLEITKVRVERLQEISAADCEAEGISREPYKNLMVNAMRADYHQLWDKINAERGFGWKKNPLVWVIEFKRVEVAQ